MDEIVLHGDLLRTRVVAHARDGPIKVLIFFLGGDEGEGEGVSLSFVHISDISPYKRSAKLKVCMTFPHNPPKPRGLSASWHTPSSSLYLVRLVETNSLIAAASP